MSTEISSVTVFVKHAYDKIAIVFVGYIFVKFSNELSAVVVGCKAVRYCESTLSGSDITKNVSESE